MRDLRNAIAPISKACAANKGLECCPSQTRSPQHNSFCFPSAHGKPDGGRFNAGSLDVKWPPIQSPPRHWISLCSAESSQGQGPVQVFSSYIQNTKAVSRSISNVWCLVLGYEQSLQIRYLPIQIDPVRIQTSVSKWKLHFLVCKLPTLRDPLQRQMRHMRHIFDNDSKTSLAPRASIQSADDGAPLPALGSTIQLFEIEPPPEEQQWRPGVRDWLIFICIVILAMMDAFDATVLLPALPVGSEATADAVPGSSLTRLQSIWPIPFRSRWPAPSG